MVEKRRVENEIKESKKIRRCYSPSSTPPTFLPISTHPISTSSSNNKEIPFVPPVSQKKKGKEKKKKKKQNVFFDRRLRKPSEIVIEAIRTNSLLPDTYKCSDSSDNDESVKISTSSPSNNEEIAFVPPVSQISTSFSTNTEEIPFVPRVSQRSRRVLRKNLNDNFVNMDEVVTDSEGEDEEQRSINDSHLELSQPVILDAFCEPTTDEKLFGCTTDGSYEPSSDGEETSDEESSEYKSDSSIDNSIAKKIMTTKKKIRPVNNEGKSRLCSLFDFDDHSDSDGENLKKQISNVVNRILPNTAESKECEVEVDESEGESDDDDRQEDDENQEKEKIKRKFGTFSSKVHKDKRKMHCCFLCKEWIYRLPRHLKTKHKKQKQIEDILKLPQKEQMRHFTILRRKGDFEANINHVKEGNPDYLTVVRSGNDLNVKNYIPCINCHGFFKKTTLARHLMHCSAGENETKTTSNIQNVRASKMLLQEKLATDDKFKDLKIQLLSRMSEDEVTNVIKHDEGVLLYVYTLWEKGGQSAFNEISGKLRCVGRFILEYRKINKADPNTSSAFSLIDPSKWDDIVKAVKSLVNHQGDDKVGIPSLLLRTGRCLEAIACAKRAWGIQSRDRDSIEDARSYLELHNHYWHIYAKHALSTIQSRKDKKPELLPLTADFRKLKDYLLKEINTTVTEASKRPITFQEWSWLQKLIVVRIITFNARRGGESTKIFISDWEKCQSWKRQEDIDAIQDPLEKLLAKRLKVVYVKGKRKRRVPILFTEEMQKAIKILLAARSDMGVNPENHHLFPRPSRGSENAIRGWDVVNKVSRKATLQKPELMTSTKIRKHMATVLQLLDMTDAELNWVTDHLGHTADVHKTWYRQEESTVELTKVAKLLIAKDRGEVFQNKKMKDLCVFEEDISEGDTESEENDSEDEESDRQTKNSITMTEREEIPCCSKKRNISNDVPHSTGSIKKRISYSIEEISATKTFFASNIAAGNVPSHYLVKCGQEKFSVLKHRTTQSIRSKVFSMITKK